MVAPIGMLACTSPTGVLLLPMPSTLSPTVPVQVPAVVRPAVAAPLRAQRPAAMAHRRILLMSGSVSFRVNRDGEALGRECPCHTPRAGGCRKPRPPTSVAGTPHRSVRDHCGFAVTPCAETLHRLLSLQAL